MRRGLHRVRGVVLSVAVLAGVAFVAPAVLEPTAAQAHGERALVACVQEQGFSDFVVVVRAPRRCVLHYVGSPFDSAHLFPVVSIRWSGWGRSVAHGRGTFIGNMNFRARATIVLSRPRACGRGVRIYTRVRTTIQGRSSSGPLPACSG